MRPVSFFKGLTWLIILNLLVKPVWILMIDRQVQNLVGHEEYGRYFALFNLCFVLSFLADAGMTNMLNQRIASRERLDLWQLFRYKIVLILSYAILCVMAGLLTGISHWNLFFYIISIHALTSLFVFFRNIITAHQHFTPDALFSVLDKFLMVILCTGFIYASEIFGSIDLVIFLRVQLFSTATASVAAMVFLLRKDLFSGDKKETLTGLLAKTAPFAVIILLMSMHYRLDGFLLERMHIEGPTETGIYAAAFRLLDATNILGYLAASFLVPFIARNQFDKEILNKTLGTTTHIMLFFAVGVSSFCLMFPEWIQQVMYNSNDPYISKVIQLCLASLPAYFLVHIYGSVLVATSRKKIFSFLLFIAVLVNIILNLFLIPEKGAEGAAIAALVSQYFLAFSVYFTAQEKLKGSWEFKPLLVYFLLAVVLVMLFYSGKLLLINVWLILAFSVLITLLLLTLLTGFLKKSTP